MQGLKTLDTSGFYGDTTRWFIGTVVRNTGDPLSLGRLKVRIVGIHDNPEIEDADLPWASVLIPTTEVGLMYGRGPRIGPGSQVFGLFLDGFQSQQPLVIGSIPYTLTPTETQIRQAAQRGGSFEETYASGYEGGSGGAAIGGPGTLAGNSKVEQSFNWFMSEVGGGYTAEQSAGIVGNLMAESGNFADDVISTQRRGDGGRAHGIAQWHPNRWNPFLDWCRRNSQDPYTLASQLRWVTLELDGSESRAKAALQNTSRADHAAISFMRKYERPQLFSTISDFREPPYNPNGSRVGKRAGEDERVANAIDVFNSYALVSRGGSSGNPAGTPSAQAQPPAWSSRDAQNVEDLVSIAGQGEAFRAKLTDGERAYAIDKGYIGGGSSSSSSSSGSSDPNRSGPQ